MAITINSENFESEVLNSKVPVLIDFWSVTCGPCAMLAPNFEEAEKEVPDVKFCKIEISENIKLVRSFKVMSVPTLILIQDGKEVKRSVGFISKEEIIDMLP